MGEYTLLVTRKQVVKRIDIFSNEEAMGLFGEQDRYLKMVESAFPVRVVTRGEDLVVSGNESDVARVSVLFDRLLAVMRGGTSLTEQHVVYAIAMTDKGEIGSLTEVFSDIIIVTARGKQIKPKTIGQKTYVEAMRRNGIAFGIGPAGTGKTYLAMAMAVAALKNREVNRIVLTRPAVEAGEKLGFLPGDLQEKVDPYLRPLYDALFDILGVENFDKHMSRGVIEIAPLAYMRGRTLDDSFVILDEAQNTTPEQMKMFLTRLGYGSKAVITGDVTQVDLPKDQVSGLQLVRDILRDIDGIAFCYLSEHDVVRHPLVQKIIAAYDRYDKEKNGGS